VPNNLAQELASKANIALPTAGAPAHVRLKKLARSHAAVAQ